jgi:HEPN domain-containing protein/predicted nucleotidyltransferase
MDLSQRLPKLPPEKREEIQKALDIILEVANPEKVILFGSYAKDTWVDDITVEDNVTFAYHSDFDFLVVTRDNSVKEFEVKSMIENRAIRRVNGIVSALVHSIDYINEGLSYHQYFFKQIIDEGILLFDSGEFEFVIPDELTPQQLKDRAQEYFDIWFPMGQDFLIDGKSALKRGSLRVSNFHLHQAAEHFFAALLLVLTGFKPKSHNLENLRFYSKNLSFEVYKLFADSAVSEHESQIFKILKKGYVDARYKREFVVTAGEIEFALNKVVQMEKMVETISRRELDRLASLIH